MAVLLAISGASVGGSCGGEEASIDLRLLYPVVASDEPPSRPWLGFGCGSDRVLGECVGIKLSACPGGRVCTSVLGDEVDAEVGTLASVQGGTFELPTGTATREDLRLQVGMYGDGHLLATGEARDVSFAEDVAVALTLSPVGDRAACGEPAGDETPSLTRRAFHTATLLPNGEVLIAGGLSGPVLELKEEVNALEERIDVLDPRSGVAQHVVIANDVPGETGAQLLRAFHHAAYVGTDAEGRYTVRLFGGIRAGSAGASAWISNTGEGMPLQLLISGTPTGPDAEPAPPVDLRYDPRDRSVTVEPVQNGASYPKASFGGFAALTGTLGGDTSPGGASGYYLGGGLGEWTARQESTNAIAPVLDGLFMGAGGAPDVSTPPPLLTGRVGATALGIGEDEVLFWGGNVWSIEGEGDPTANLAAELAEVHHPRDATGPRFVTVTGVPVPPTSFHAAAVAAVEGHVHHIVVAGGYLVGPLEALTTTGFAPVPLTLVSFDAARGTAAVSEIDCGAPGCDELVGDVAYMTATWMAPGRVLLAGGNFVYTGPGAGAPRTKYGARAVAGVVTVTDGTAVFEPVDLGTARYGHSATRLLDGSVLILGGVTLACVDEDERGRCRAFGDLTPLGTYEVYNPGLGFPADRSCE